MIKTISFVIPCYCSESTLSNVIKEIEDKMESMKENGKEYYYEIVLIDDCSPDNTLNVISELCKKQYIKALRLSKNFGQHAALMAGIRNTKGDFVVCLDDDGQTPANEVDKLLEKLEEGYDAVYAKYENKHHSNFRNLGSKVNDYMLRSMLGKPSQLYISSYFAVKRFVVDNMITYNNSYPYVIGLVLRATRNITNVVVQHRSRTAGASGYNLKKLLKLWLNGFTAFSVKPLRLAILLGGISALLSFMYEIYVIINKLLNPNVPLGFSSIMCAIGLFSGLIMIMLGLIGEYIGRIYISINNSPQYVISERINIDL